MILVVCFLANMLSDCRAQLYLEPFVPGVVKVTDITHCGDDRLFITEQPGRIRVCDLQGNLNPVPFLDITAKVLDASGEQGLLGLVFSPTYSTDRRFYVNYINNTSNTVIARFTALESDPNLADTASEEILFIVTQPYSNHNGGAMHFGPDGMLYISLGDGGAGGDPQNNAQNLQSRLGKLLRIDVSGDSGYAIPPGNPFIGVANADSMIWSYGLRNAWRFSFDRLTGDKWIADVGQGLWEEVNFQPAASAGGENYGWRCYEGMVPFDLTGCLPISNYDFPIHVYQHPQDGCSVTGGYVYRGALHGEWFGKYFFTDYCKGVIRSLAPNDSGGYDYQLHGQFENLAYTTFGEDRYGELYIGKVSTGVFKLNDSTSCDPLAYIVQPDTIRNANALLTLRALESPGLAYQWFFNDELIANAVTASLTVSLSGRYKVEVTNLDLCTNLSKTVVVFMNAPANFWANPNPASDYCEVLWPEGLSGYKTLEIFDIEGRLCETVIPDSDAFNYRLNTYKYSEGMYVIRMTHNGETYHLKLMKQ